mmetsp:Transcript_110784/g.174654  ORF Transcript_110784/g.174654 Transcript_110784/m.174654 type:complete len:321 (+) Transcript_110784:76-1038(+)
MTSAIVRLVVAISTMAYVPLEFLATRPAVIEASPDASKEAFFTGDRVQATKDIFLRGELAVKALTYGTVTRGAEKQGINLQVEFDQREDGQTNAMRLQPVQLQKAIPLEWQVTPHHYCPKSGNTAPVQLDNYGFKLDFKPASNERCREECAKKPDCKVYTYGIWNKGVVLGFNLNTLGFGRHYRCQLYQMCDATEADKKWAMMLYEKPANFVYVQPPPDYSEHNFNVFGALASSVAMAVNLLYVIRRTLSDQISLLLVLVAAIVAVIALLCDEVPDSNNTYFLAIVALYCINISYFLWKVFDEDEKQRSQVFSSGSKKTD